MLALLHDTKENTCVLLSVPTAQAPWLPYPGTTARRRWKTARHFTSSGRAVNSAFKISLYERSAIHLLGSGNKTSQCFVMRPKGMTILSQSTYISRSIIDLERASCFWQLLGLEFIQCNSVATRITDYLPNVCLPLGSV